MAETPAALATARVVHVVWPPLGPQMLEGFVDSWRAHDAGVPSRLLLIFNGFSGSEVPAEYRSIVEGVEHDCLLLNRPVQDLEAYRIAIAQASEKYTCFVNSYSRFQAQNWLEKLTTPLQNGLAVGMVGATGSAESSFTSAPASLVWKLWRDFPPFPNYHLRTNGFAAKTDLLRTLKWGSAEDKHQAHKLESGWGSLSRQVRRRGLRTLVVGRDGQSYVPKQWRESLTYRSGAQDNLLISDNRTDDFAASDPARRRELARMAWGRKAIL